MRSKSAKRMVGKWINVPKGKISASGIASFRGYATIRSLSERSGHSTSRAYRTGFMSPRPNPLDRREHLTGAHFFIILRMVNVDGQFHYFRIPSPHMANEAPE